MSVHYFGKYINIFRLKNEDIYDDQLFEFRVLVTLLQSTRSKNFLIHILHHHTNNSIDRKTEITYL